MRKMFIEPIQQDCPTFPYQDCYYSHHAGCTQLIFLHLLPVIIVLILGLVISIVTMSDVNTQDDNGVTRLMYSAWLGKYDECRSLVQQGADINIRNKRGETAVMEAAEGGHEEIVQLLIEAGADINNSNKWGRTAMMEAVNRYRRWVP